MSYDGGCGNVACELCKADAAAAREKWEARRVKAHTITNLSEMELVCSNCGGQERVFSYEFDAIMQAAGVPKSDPAPMTDDVALREMAAWLRPERGFRVGQLSHAVHLKCYDWNRTVGDQSWSVVAPTIAEAWAALKQQGGWPG